MIRKCLGNAKHAVKHKVAKMLVSCGLIISCATEDERFKLSAIHINEMRMLKRCKVVLALEVRR